jgi:hypothetical protein
VGSVLPAPDCSGYVGHPEVVGGGYYPAPDDFGPAPQVLMRTTDGFENSWSDVTMTPPPCPERKAIRLAHRPTDIPSPPRRRWQLGRARRRPRRLWPGRPPRRFSASSDSTDEPRFAEPGPRDRRTAGRRLGCRGEREPPRNACLDHPETDRGVRKSGDRGLRRPREL